MESERKRERAEGECERETVHAWMLAWVFVCMFVFLHYIFYVFLILESNIGIHGTELICVSIGYSCNKHYIKISSKLAAYLPKIEKNFSFKIQIPI